jgi:hypothetical protein
LGKYNFDGGVTGNTYIRAIWRTVGQYQVAYSAEGVNEDGTPLYTKDENGNFTTTRVTGSNPPVDALRYADKSNSSIREALTDPEGYVFNGWYYNGKVYSPGDAFTVISELDVTELDPLRDDTITIYPVFVSYENLPVKTTHIYWYSNTVDINGDPIVGVPANGEIVNTERDGELQINEKVPVMSINELIGSVDYYDGYTFLGWAKVADDGTAAPRDLWLTLESDGTYSMISENGHKITGITHIASDANLPYDNMVAMWVKMSYTVTVKKVVNGFDSDQEVPFAFAPGFTPNINKQVTDENGNTFYQNTQENFGLAGRTTTIYPEETEPITFTSSKTYYEIPYATRFSFTGERR